jgi:hypothetical protein
MRKTIKIISSNGDLFVNARTGKVVRVMERQTNENKDISRVNLPDYRAWDRKFFLPRNRSEDEIDIIFIGFWGKDKNDPTGPEKYFEPCYDMREESVNNTRDQNPGKPTWDAAVDIPAEHRENAVPADPMV